MIEKIPQSNPKVDIACDIFYNGTTSIDNKSLEESKNIFIKKAENFLDQWFADANFSDIVQFAISNKENIRGGHPKIIQKFSDFFNKKTSKTFMWRFVNNGTFQDYFGNRHSVTEDESFLKEIIEKVSPEDTASAIIGFNSAERDKVEDDPQDEFGIQAQRKKNNFINSIKDKLSDTVKYFNTQYYATSSDTEKVSIQKNINHILMLADADATVLKGAYPARFNRFNQLIFPFFDAKNVAFQYSVPAIIEYARANLQNLRNEEQKMKNWIKIFNQALDTDIIPMQNYFNALAVDKNLNLQALEEDVKGLHESQINAKRQLDNLTTTLDTTVQALSLYIAQRILDIQYGNRTTNSLSKDEENHIITMNGKIKKTWEEKEDILEKYQWNNDSDLKQWEQFFEDKVQLMKGSLDELLYMSSGNNKYLKFTEQLILISELEKHCNESFERLNEFDQYYNQSAKFICYMTETRDEVEKEIKKKNVNTKTIQNLKEKLEKSLQDFKQFQQNIPSNLKTPQFIKTDNDFIDKEILPLIEQMKDLLNQRAAKLTKNNNNLRAMAEELNAKNNIIYNGKVMEVRRVKPVERQGEI